MILICTLCLFSCGQVDEVSQLVMNEIDSIGDVSLEDETQINKINELYKSLTDKQKNQVENYIKLIEAQNTLEELKNEQELARIAEIEAQLVEKERYLNIQREYYPDIESAITMLRNECIFPETLNIKEIIFYGSMSSLGYYYKTIYISYSAENRSGNTLSGYYSYSPGSTVGIDASDYYQHWRQIAIGENDVISYKIGENFYSDTESIEDSDKFVFIVDLEDYKQSGY